jgi:hypothetical protein
LCGGLWRELATGIERRAIWLARTVLAAVLLWLSGKIRACHAKLLGIDWGHAKCDLESLRQDWADWWAGVHARQARGSPAECAEAMGARSE